MEIATATALKAVEKTVDMGSQDGPKGPHIREKIWKKDGDRL